MRAFGPEVTRDRDLIIITVHTENRTQNLQRTETSCVLCLNVFREPRLDFQSFSFLPFTFFCWVLPCDKPRYFVLTGAQVVSLIGISHAVALVWKPRILNMASPWILVFDGLVAWF